MKQLEHAPWDEVDLRLVAQSQPVVPLAERERKRIEHLLQEVFSGKVDMPQTD